jgi:2-C-methyl-D-erythritol 2,4-cyclodiphosphate synthase
VPIPSPCWPKLHAVCVPQVGNVDSTIIAQAPKMAPHILGMRQRIAQALLVAVEQVSVKAKTAEHMGPVGKGESIETRAVCLLMKGGS